MAEAGFCWNDITYMIVLPTNHLEIPSLKLTVTQPLNIGLLPFKQPSMFRACCNI